MKRKLLLIKGRLEVVEWLDKSDFQGRFNMVLQADENMQPIVDPQHLDIITVPDDCIVCDYCNDDLITFPVPVVGGSALCPECFKRVILYKNDFAIFWLWFFVTCFIISSWLKRNFKLIKIKINLLVI